MLIRTRLSSLIIGCTLRACLFVALGIAQVSLSFAGQSLVINQSTSVSFTDPSMPVDQLWRVEMHIDHWELPGGGGSTSQAIVTLGGVGFRLRTYGANAIGLFDIRNTYNSVGGFPYCRFSMEDRSNILLRVQRTPTGLACEIWNVDGTGYVLRTHTRTAVGTPGSGGTLGDAQANTPSIHIGFLRVLEDNIPTGSRPPVVAEVGDRDWKFDGDGKAAAGGHNIDTGGFSFAPTDTGVGIVAAINKGDPRSWMPFGPLRAGHVNHITSNSYTMADDTWEPECFWQQVPHAEEEPLSSRANIANPHSCDKPGISGLVHGPYRFRLEVRDSQGRTAQAEQSFGAVAYDDNGVVIYPDERLNTILGPMMALGKNPWEWVDRQNILMAQNVWQNYSVFGGTWEPEWLRKEVNGVERKGTIYRQYAAPHRTKVYGVGTNFTEIFCGGEVGPAVPSTGRYIVLYRPRPYLREVKSCQSDTEITTTTWEHPEIPDIEPPGTEHWGTYGFLPTTVQGGWIGASNQSNVNFYDNALAHYRLYFQSGWYDAHVAARWLADRWMTNPWNRTGNQARDAAYVGMMIRLMIDGGLAEFAAQGWDPLPAMRSWMNSNFSCISRSSGSGNPSDVRETAYCTVMKAITALLDPDEEEAASARENLRKGATDKWKNHQGVNGNWFDNQTFNNESRVSYVENGSATVTKYSGTDYPGNYCGIIATDEGVVSIDADRVTMRGIGTNFTGTAGKYLYLTGLWNGKPWAQVSRIQSGSSPTATQATLSIPWRGDLNSPITNWAILDSAPFGDNARIHQMFYPVNEAGTQRTGSIDKTWYWCKRVNGSMITLDRPYEGDTSGGNHYRKRDGVLNVGLGQSQPFYHGIVAYGFHLASEALKNAYPEAAEVYREMLGTTAKWLLSNDAFNPATKGLRYASVSSPTCGGDGNVGTAFGCWGTTANSGRSYNIETIQGISFAFLKLGDKALRDAFDGLYNFTYGRTGYASSDYLSDGNWNEATDEAGYRTNVNLGTKNYGQAWGIGGGQTWPAARLGGVSSPAMRQSSIDVAFDKIPGAVTARVLLRYPSGARATFECTSSPCMVDADLRQGDHAYQVVYLDVQGKELARGGEVLFRAEQ
jgi:hypothetical protein